MLAAASSPPGGKIVGVLQRASRFALTGADGNMPPSLLTRSIEFYGTQLRPILGDMPA